MCQDVVGKNKFLVQIKYGKKIDTISSSLLYLCLKEEVAQELYDDIYELPRIG